MFKQFKIACMMLLSFTILTGLIYPVLIAGIGQLVFPWQAQGSLFSYQGSVVGSQYIGQWFQQPRYFLGRPSATAQISYNALYSGASNLAPSNPVLVDIVRWRVRQWQQLDPNNVQPIPIELVTASASGLDPEITPRAAFYQVPRVARLNHLSEKKLQNLIDKMVLPRTFGILGEPRVNVLALNMALDRIVSTEKDN